MNFYIGDSIEKLNINDKNIELSDDLLDFLYKNKYSFDLDEFPLQEIDPYDDTVINHSQLQQWLVMCNSIVSCNVLEQYEDSDEAECFKELSILIHEALNKNLNLIIIGD